MRSSQLALAQYDSDKIVNNYLELYDPILEPLIERKIILLELGIFKGSSLLLWRDYFPLGTIVGIDIKLPKDFSPTERIHVFEGRQDDPKFLSRVANETAPNGFDIIIDDASHIGELTKIAFWHLFDNHLKPGGLYIIEDWGTGYWNDWPDGKSLDLEEYLKPSLKQGLFLLSNQNATKGLRLKEAVRNVIKKLHLVVPMRYVVGKWRLKTPMPCHSYGMDGFIKQLIDEQAAHYVTSEGSAGTPKRGSKFKNMIITSNIVFIRKND
jgi:hypothetical protein